MTEDNNKILNDINNSGGEIEKEEHKLYKEFLDFHSKYKTKADISKTKIIEFIPLKNEEIDYDSDLRKYAAESTADSSNFGTIQSYFYISAENKYALKCINISENELCVNILSEEISTQEMLLFLPELNKYYLPNENGEYIVSGASAKNLAKLNFKVYLSKEKIKIYENKKSYSLLSVNNLSSPELSVKNDSFLIIKLNKEDDFSAAAMINDKVREFVKMENGFVHIPLLFLQENSVIYLF